jgi:large subunit ribosomal protein L31
MKPNIHPKYTKLTVQLPRGDSFETYSTYGQDKLILDVDFRNHMAWTKTGTLEANTSSAKVSKFNKKFGNISFSTSPSAKESK